jgi:nucleotide-binding universal stress UspA family protein
MAMDGPARVLVATDGSTAADAGISFVDGVDWPAGSTIRVLSVIPTDTAVFGGPWPALALVRMDELLGALRQEAERVVGDATGRLERPGRTVLTAVRPGRPATVIVEAASDMHADLVVVGSRGHGTIEQMLLGSVSAEVVDHARVPVLVARGAGSGRVVLAWDGSDGARAAADVVRDWPMFAGSTVEVVSVADPGIPWWTGFPDPVAPQTISLYVDAAEASRQRHVAMADELATALRTAGRTANPHAPEGDAATQIIATARSTGADLIVLGTHGRTGIARLVLGSVARNVLHHAPCSVLVARVPA